MAKFKRKKLNLNVNKYFQQWLLLRILGVTVLCSLIAALILYFYARNEITSSFFEAHLKIRRVSDLLVPVVIAGSLVSLISGIVLSLFLPQKIAGPLYRIEQDLKPVREGDLTAMITLREGDILKELVHEINSTNMATRDRVQQAKDALEALLETVDLDSQSEDFHKHLQETHTLLAKIKTN